MYREPEEDIEEQLHSDIKDECCDPDCEFCRPKNVVNWVVQYNLGGQYVLDVYEACKVHNQIYTPVEAIPFSHELPDVCHDIPTVFYGATNWINAIYQSNIWEPGVFFNPESTYPFWSKKYGEHVLNNDYKETTLNKLVKEDHNLEELIFIRPADDSKAFAGNVMTFKQIKKWGDNLFSDETDLGNFPIIISEPLAIACEWRLFLVDGKVSTGSQYRVYNRLSKDGYVPQWVIEFAKKRAEEYSPSPVFVMDVGRCGPELYVIEIGCFNSAGFYDADVTKLIKDVSEFILGGMA